MQNQKITIDVIENKEFRIAAKGYNQHEVDEVLDSICDELERIEGEMAALQTENDNLKHRAVPQPSPYAAPAPAPASPEGTFREILEMAQRVKEQTIADAETRAAEIIRNAETEARARLGNLMEEREHLEKDIEALKEEARAYKARFAEVIDAARRVLDEASDLE